MTGAIQEVNGADWEVLILIGKNSILYMKSKVLTNISIQYHSYIVS